MGFSDAFIDIDICRLFIYFNNNILSVQLEIFDFLHVKNHPPVAFAIKVSWIKRRFSVLSVDNKRTNKSL